MLPCEKCSKLISTNHVTVIAGGNFSEIHLCDACYSGVPAVSPVILRCDRCGLALHDIQARGRMGCANDYKLFARDVSACVQGYHGSAQHVGKVPKNARGIF